MKERVGNNNLLAVREVAKRISVSANTIRRWSDAGTFPPPLKLGRTVRWSEAVVEKWIESAAKHCHDLVTEVQGTR